MVCPRCGLRTPPDRETGYDGEELCPSCREAVEVTLTVELGDEVASWREEGTRRELPVLVQRVFEAACRSLKRPAPKSLRKAPRRL